MAPLQLRPSATDQQDFAVPPNTTTVTVSLATLVSGYAYAIPLPEGWPTASGTPPFPGRYGGQFQLAYPGSVPAPSGTTAFSFAPTNASSQGTVNVANVGIVLQGIGNGAASATGTATFTTSDGSTPQPVTITLTVPPLLDAPAPANTSPATQTATNPAGLQPLGLLGDGSLFLQSNTTLYVSAWPGNGGTLQETNGVQLDSADPNDPNYEIQAAVQLENGAVVAAGANPGVPNTGELSFAPAQAGPFTPVLPTATLPQGMGFSSSFPITVNGSLAVVAEYYPIDFAAGGTDGGIRVWQLDTGQTAPVLTEITPPPALMETTLFHHHGIAYDRYENLYWLLTGDGNTSRSVLVMDAGDGTWYQAVPFGELPMQATNVVPMPGCVLFISDDPQVGVLRYDRPEGKGGTIAALKQGPKLSFVIAWTLQVPFIQTDAADTEIPLATVPVYVAGDEKKGVRAAAYFGWQVQTFPFNVTNNPIPNLYTTADGYAFYEVNLGLQPYPGTGVQGVFTNGTGTVLVAVETGTSDAPWTAVEFQHADVWGAPPN